MDWEALQYVKRLAKKYRGSIQTKAFTTVIDLSGYSKDETQAIANYLGEIGHGTSPEGWDGKQYTKLKITATGDSDWLARVYHVPSQIKKEIEEAKRAAGR